MAQHNTDPQKHRLKAARRLAAAAGYKVDVLPGNIFQVRDVQLGDHTGQVVAVYNSLEELEAAAKEETALQAAERKRRKGKKP